ncbi:MAG: hypothetical protein A2915_02815 [Candidatus Yanofskybacteria bacterium RIFCSPLOWO2_01_FULL_41_34]|uniref:BioF2-like acetyltransferase domain-containing protein n=1 Tax=Candidatus Yanofskybacteria bacterium RIFCSPHIGHO2_01_FULL_41_26 TaxID=1802661 RepID=A0A1F8EEE2_9BACT|nr:MAG: hypothetical protein A2649_03780 [Candidatus Yanofskybacteria bacterium RIFCSPHIGHO2_01_FULL_41_26]OGN20968.1 MAG: hypothetical protein A2915_02815 [Candidatus Yanofskybacteria bacterium RIFCSPLOWO2_01_FULL_41_34]
MIKSFLQTQEWLDFQKYIGRKTWRFDDGKIKANIIQHDLPFGKNYLYIPHGPEINFNVITGTINNEVAKFVAYLKNLAKDQKSIFIKIEPLDDKVPEAIHNLSTSWRIKRSVKEIQPHKTVVLDLQKSEEELLAEMHHKTRYNIKVAEKYGVVVKDSLSAGEAGKDLDTFWKLLKKTTKRDRFGSHSKEYYKKLVEYFQQGEMRVDLVLAYHQDKAVAGALMMTYGDICYYLHGASDYDARSMMAPYALHWENIKTLQASGCKFYDLWGIDSQRWPGVTRFKLGWGGREVEYSGSFDLPVSRFWYFTYKVARKVF